MNIVQDNQNYFNPFLNVNVTNQMNLFQPQEAFMLGNLFKDLYMSYNGFSNYCLQPMNQRQKALLEVQINGFIAHEINLYLDMHPNDQKMIQMYHEYTQRAVKATEAFERQFGPLTVSSSSTECPFQWIQGPWPWEHQS